jgi:hypothetical protein
MTIQNLVQGQNDPLRKCPLFSQKSDMQASQNKYGPAIVKLNTARSIPQFCRSR